MAFAGGDVVELPFRPALFVDVLEELVGRAGSGVRALLGVAGR
jgi:hypothetical protein